MSVDVLAAPTRGPGDPAGGVPPFIWTACLNGSCRVYGQRRQVWLSQIAAGVVAVPARLLCAACGFSLPLSIFTPAAEEEDLMPKLHADRPPTYKADIPAGPDTPAVELEPAQGGIVLAPADGNEHEHPGHGEPIDTVEARVGETVELVEPKPVKKAAKTVRGRASAKLEGLKADG